MNGAIKEQIIMKNRAKIQSKLSTYEELKQDFEYKSNKDSHEHFSLDKFTQNLHKKFYGLFYIEDKIESKLSEKNQKI